MSFLAIVFFVFSANYLSAGRDITFYSNDLPDVSLKGHLSKDGHLSIHSDDGVIIGGKSDCKKITFISKAFGRISLDDDLTTCPSNRVNGKGVLLLRGKSLTDVLGLKTTDIESENIKPMPYEDVLSLLFYGDNAQKHTKKTSDLIFEGINIGASSFQPSKPTHLPKIQSYPMDFFVKHLKKIARKHQIGTSTDLKTLPIEGPKLVGIGVAIAAYMNSQLLERDFIVPSSRDDLVQTYLTMTGNRNISAQQSTWLNTYFDMLIGHGMNLSTSILLQVASGGGDVLNIIDAASKALDTPAHGRAAFEVATMLETIGTTYGGSVNAYLDAVGQKKAILYGFGHRIYKHGTDPRADVLEALVKEIVRKTKDRELKADIDLTLRLKEAALKNDYIKRLGLQPNVDYYAHLLLRACNVDKRLATIMFAVGRMGSWVADLYHYGKQERKPIKRPQDKLHKNRLIKQNGTVTMF